MNTSIRWAVDFEAWQPSNTQIGLASSCVQAEEKARIGQFVFRRDLKASLLGRLLMRKFLSTYGGVPYKEILLERDERGKPFSRQAANLSFNVSHQGRYSVLAGEIGNRTIGVDIMPVLYEGGKNLNEFFRLMSRQFSPFEWRTIRSGLTELEQMAMFNRHWALKESYVKATGTGIVVDLQSLEFRVKTRNLSESCYVTDTVLFISGVAQPWKFEEILLNNHVVAVALNSDNPSGKSPKFEKLSVDEILESAMPLRETDEHFVCEYFKKDERPY